jgi:hypothetical protein
MKLQIEPVNQNVVKITFADGRKITLSDDGEGKIGLTAEKGLEMSVVEAHDEMKGKGTVVVGRILRVRTHPEATI